MDDTEHDTMYKALERLLRTQCHYEAEFSRTRRFQVFASNGTMVGNELRVKCPSGKIDALEPIRVKFSFSAPVSREGGEYMSCMEISKYHLEVTFDGVDVKGRAYVVDENGISSKKSVVLLPGK